MLRNGGKVLLDCCTRVNGSLTSKRPTPLTSFSAKSFFSSESDKPPKITSPIYREEEDPVLFDLSRKTYLRNDELNPVDNSPIPTKEGVKLSESTEVLPELSQAEIDKLVHYARKEGKGKVGILEPFEETYRRLATFCQQRVFMGLRSVHKNFYPAVSARALVFPSATVTGRVEIYNDTSIWYNCIIKAQSNTIKIGGGTNIQDGTVIVESPIPLGLDHDGSTIIGHHVTVGHNCVIHAATIEDRCLVGMGSVLEDNSYMEENSMLGAGSVLKSGSRVKTGQLWVGSPAKFVRNLTGLEILSIEQSSAHYIKLARTHLRELPPTSGPLNPETMYHINV
eukprot:TRINITY_DN5741_c0_g1_i1.p1 TRINITY_DN5741_c0_g1~~TRINITY_DN5741_c0_g1_i1.p1  ORF type:complete len:338 (-),score=80.84 TRINITY_DN5741_c0_g1_i1:78-1091(-)